MTRAQAKHNFKAIEHWMKGGSLWYINMMGKWAKMNSEDVAFHIADKTTYLIEDIFFEQRKAFAEGKKIEVKIFSEWNLTDNPKWLREAHYRIIEPTWYDNIPEEGVICWVWDYDKSQQIASVVVKHAYSNIDDHKFSNRYGAVWKNAKPITAYELYKSNTDADIKA